MSTLLGQEHRIPLQREEDLLTYFQQFAKERATIRVGLEAEFFAVDATTGKALPYEGPVGIHSILKALREKFSYEAICESDAIIALKDADRFITLEPGGQVELSAPPVKNVFEIEAQVQSFLNQLRELHETFPGVRWISFGIQPFSGLEEVTWVPKERYGIMANYLGARGKLAHWMMKMTATNQLNFDYMNEEHAVSSLKTVFAITPIVTALFANSSFSEGRPNGYLSRRAEIWRYTDPERTGILENFLKDDATFDTYLRYLLEMPMIFIVRGGRWIPMKGVPFRDFLRHGHQGFEPTLADFELHLSTAFPEARLKQYLEIRGMDAQRPALIPAVAAFWKGILYDAQTRESAWMLVSGYTLEERRRLLEAVPKEGLRARLGNEAVFDLAKELVDLACSSLARQTTREEERDECVFLQRIRETIIRPGRTCAEQVLEQWGGPLQQDPGRLLDLLSVL